MDELNEQLYALINAACQTSPEVWRRRKAVTQIIKLMQQSGKVWRGYPSDAPYYEDALQKTWLWFCQSLDRYDLYKGSVLSWFNTYLEYRLKDERNRVAKENAQRVHPYLTEEGWNEPIDSISGHPDIPPILENVLEWMMANQAELCRIHLTNRPDVNCFSLTLHRLPLPETYLEWKALSLQFKAHVPTLSSFYQKHCLPKLLDYGRSQGYCS
jgi:hypothetical protein